MTSMRLLLGATLLLATGYIMEAQNGFTGTAAITLQFTPAIPSMADSQIEILLAADLSAVQASDGSSPVLSSYSIPVGFDPSRVRLVSAVAGDSPGYSAATFAMTEPAVANARGFVTVMNMRAGAEDPGPRVELARLIFQPVRPGKAPFLVGSARAVRPGTLTAVPPPAGSTVQRISWSDRLYTLEILSGGTASSLLCPSWFSVPGMYQSMALLNEGTGSASIQVFGWASYGELVQPVSGTNPSLPIPLDPLRQEAMLIDQLFSPGNMSVEAGWIEVRSSHPDISGFFIQAYPTADGMLGKADGADMSYAPAARIVFPLLGSDSSQATEIYLANPGSSPVTAHVSVVNPDGSTGQSIDAPVTRQGTVSQQISRTDGYVDVEVDGGRLLGFERFGNSEALAVLNGQDGTAVSNRLMGPHFASGFLGGNLRVNTQVALVNPSGAESRVLLRLLDEQGREITAPVARTMAPKSQISSPGWQLFGLGDPRSTAQLVSGTFVVESDQGVVGALSFGDPVTGAYLAALPLMSTSAAKREILFGHVAVGIQGNVDYFTGLALVNPSASATAHIELQLYKNDGSLVAKTNSPYELGPNGKAAKLVQELIPDFTGSQFGGFVRLVSDVEVYAYMLFGDSAYNFVCAVPVR